MENMDMQGTMHPTVPNGIVETYKSLYRTAIANYNIEDLSCFFPLAGKNYYVQQVSKEGVEKALAKEAIPPEQLEQYFESSNRLMIVGRCPNGWMEFSSGSADDFAELASSEMLNEDGASWLQDDGKAVETYIRKSDGKECRYNANMSAFFRAIRNILYELKPATTIDPRWFDYFVWTNLYCFSPVGGGNADDKMKAVQLEDCKKLLALQIEYYNPTHIVFITDWDYWFDDFKDIFPEVIHTGNSVTDNVVGVGKYKNAKVVVSIRPDRTKPTDPDEDLFAADVIKALQ